MSGKFLLLDKPLNVSSFFCIKPLKREFKKVGHTGTLDPFASGLLVVAVEKATKFIQYLPTSKKYLFSIQFGYKTDSDDVSGKIIAKNEKIPKLEDVKLAVKNFIGVVRQIPSKFSAIKINGKRAYKMARNGDVFDVPMRNVVVNSLRVLSFENDTADFEISCEKGTYVRTLAADLCEKLEVLGCVVKLRRIESNGFILSEKKTKEEKENMEVSLSCFFEYYPILTISFELFEELKLGKTISTQFILIQLNNKNLKDEQVYCLSLNNEFHGLVKIVDFNVKSLCLI